MRFSLFSKFARVCAVAGTLTAAGSLPVRAQQNAATASVFGSTTRSESALIGILYDLKQTQAHEQTGMRREKYLEIFARFVDTDWDEAILNRYYRVTRPLYTTQVFIPRMNADSAPKAFGVEQLVQPRLWLVHYKGQVIPPEDGTYRFLGTVDDVMAVAVNGKTVLAAYWPSMKPRAKWFPKEPCTAKWIDGSEYTAGDWFEAKAGKPIDLDIIMGECPGGLFHAGVAIQRKGTVYSTDKSGKPLIPPFQLAVTELTAKYPGARPWKGCQ